MSFPRYPKYKASGVEWLDEVPESWEVRRIKHLGKTITGGTPKTEEPEYWTDGDVPWLPSGKVQNGTIHKEDADTFITKRALAESAAKLIKPGSALIALTGATCANAAFLAFESTANQSVVGIEPKSNSNGRFIYYSLLAQREQVLTHKSGGAQGGINQEDVRNLVITAPEKVEQTAIAEFLDRETGKIDELVAEQRRLMELLKEKRQAVISHAVTKGLNPHAPMKPSGIEWLGEVPEHWVVQRVKFAAKMDSGHTPSRSVPEYWENCTIPWVSLNDTKSLKVDDYINETAIEISQIGMANSSAHLIPAGSVVFTRDATIGLTAILTRPMAVSQHLITWTPNRSKLTSEFLLRVFRAMEQYLDSYTMGSTIKTIGMPDVRKLTFALPPIEEQLEIRTYLDNQLAKFDTLTAEAQRAIDLLQERRTALISAAVTGQIDVRLQTRN